jgi:hypothetical protein
MRRRGRENESESQFVASSSSPRLLTLSFLSGPALGLLHQRAPSLALPQKRARAREQIRISFSLLRHFCAPSLTLLSLFSLLHTSRAKIETPASRSHVCFLMLLVVLFSLSLSLAVPFSAAAFSARLCPKNQKSKIEKNSLSYHLSPVAWSNT